MCCGPIDAEEIGAGLDLVALDLRGERLVLEALDDALRLERRDPVGTHEAARDDEPGQLVARDAARARARVAAVPHFV